MDQTKTSVFLHCDKNSNAVVFHIVEGDLLKSIISACHMSQLLDQRWIFFTREAQLCILWCHQFVPYSMTYKFSSDIRQSYFYIVEKFKGGYDPNRSYLENRTKTAIVL